MCLGQEFQVEQQQRTGSQSAAAVDAPLARMAAAMQHGVCSATVTGVVVDGPLGAQHPAIPRSQARVGLGLAEYMRHLDAQHDSGQSSLSSISLSAQHPCDDVPSLPAIDGCAPRQEQRRTFSLETQPAAMDVITQSGLACMPSAKASGSSSSDGRRAQAVSSSGEAGSGVTGQPQLAVPAASGSTQHKLAPASGSGLQTHNTMATSSSWLGASPLLLEGESQQSAGVTSLSVLEHGAVSPSRVCPSFNSQPFPFDTSTLAQLETPAMTLSSSVSTLDEASSVASSNMRTSASSRVTDSNEVSAAQSLLGLNTQSTLPGQQSGSGSLTSVSPDTSEHQEATAGAGASRQALLKDSSGRYACPHAGCDKKFSTSGHARRHSHTHAAPNPFVCPHDECDTTFTRRDNCAQHQRNRHGRVVKAYRVREEPSPSPEQSADESS